MEPRCGATMAFLKKRCPQTVLLSTFYSFYICLFCNVHRFLVVRRTWKEWDYFIFTKNWKNPGIFFTVQQEANKY